MTHNRFHRVLVEKSFTEGVSGLWFSPDTKYGDGYVVELVGTSALVILGNKKKIYEDTHTGLETFLEEVE